MLTRALVNLIDNALKHGSGHGGHVQCELVAAGLFTAFRRGGTGAPGAGLGLAFVQAVARHHGGRAGWRSQAQGNVFFIELPATFAG